MLHVLVEEYPFFLAGSGGIEGGFSTKTRCGKGRSGAGLPILGQFQMGLLGNKRVAKIAVVKNCVFLILKAQIGDLIGYRNIRAHHRNADGTLQFQIVAKQCRFPDGALDDDGISFFIHGNRIRRKSVITSMLGLPFIPVPVRTAGGAQAAGIEQSAGEGV